MTCPSQEKASPMRGLSRCISPELQPCQNGPSVPPYLRFVGMEFLDADAANRSPASLTAMDASEKRTRETTYEVNFCLMCSSMRRENREYAADSSEQVPLIQPR